MIPEEEGEPLLRLMHALYAGRPEPAACGADSTRLAALASDLGLLVPAGRRPSLTPLGYLVGNVAKEYCNWIDHGRRMPPPRPPAALLTGKAILDLGCGFGRWLWEFQEVAGSVVGVEKQPEYIELGKALAQRERVRAPKIYQGNAEALGRLVPADAFDLVFCRLMFNYVDIRAALASVAVALREGGFLWLEVEPVSSALRSLWKGERRLRSRAFAAFAVLNSFVCTATGRQLSLAAAGRQHSVHRPAYPPLWWWRNALKKVGFTAFRVEAATEASLVFWARKSTTVALAAPGDPNPR